MSDERAPNAYLVSMTDVAQLDTGRVAHSRAYDLRRRDSASGEALRTHSRARVGTALAMTLPQITMIALSSPQGLRSPAAMLIAAITMLYILCVCSIHALLRLHRSASPSQVTAALLLDIALAYLWTAASTSPAHYERALIGMAIIVHVANFYFGRRQAWRAIAAGACGYLLLVARASALGLRIDVAEELWTLALCLSASALMVLQASDVRRRLRTNVTLFEHVEEGDFAQTYDVGADRRPDAITRVGQAYNSVRTQLANRVLSDSLTGCLNRRGLQPVFHHP